MARFNITLDQEEVLQLLAQDSSNAFKTLLEKTLNQLLKVESAEQLKAQPYERNTGRTDFRNGTRNVPLPQELELLNLLFQDIEMFPLKRSYFKITSEVKRH